MVKNEVNNDGEKILNYQSMDEMQVKMEQSTQAFTELPNFTNFYSGTAQNQNSYENQITNTYEHTFAGIKQEENPDETPV